MHKLKKRRRQDIHLEPESSKIELFNRIKPSQHRIDFVPPTTDGALAFQTAMFKHAFQMHLTRVVWAAVTITHCPTNTSIASVNPSLLLYSKGYNMSIQPGFRIKRSTIAPTFATERDTGDSTFGLSTRFIHDPQLKIAWLNKRFGGPFFRHKGRPSIGYAIDRPINTKWRIGFKAEIDREQKHFGYKVVFGLTETDKNFKNSVF